MQHLRRDSGIAVSSGSSTRAVTAAAVAPLLLAGAAFATHRAAGLTAAVSVAAVAIVIVLLALLFVTRRGLRRAREGQRLAERALDAIPEALFVLAEAPRGASNLFVNAAYAALTGYGQTEATADGFDARALFAGALPVPADVEPQSARVRVRRRDGTTFPAIIELRAVPREGGGRYVLGTIEDVSAGERAADREPPAALEAPRSSEGWGSRAGQAFLSWLTHELRSPLNACVMWLDVLALGPQPDKLTKAVEAIKRGLARQAKLVSDLSDAAKVAAGRLEMHFERLDLVALIASGAGAWQLLAIGKQLKLEQRIELAAAPVDGDSARLLQALGHLVENAIASTGPNGRVGLRLYGAGEACIVEVEDTGPPLPACDEAALFTPLERVPESAKGRAGLGLGLAIAHHVAARHGGSLTASSEAASTRFVLKLPLAAAGSGPGR